MGRQRIPRRSPDDHADPYERALFQNKNAGMKMRRIMMVVPHSIYVDDNTGITVRNIFGKYDRSAMSEICLSGSDSHSAIDSFTFPNRKKGNHLDNFLYIIRCVRDEQFNHFVTEHKPEIVYCICSTIQTAIVSYYVCRKMKIPVIIHHFDNNMETAKLGLLFRPVYKALAKHMKCGFVISDSMKENYEATYGGHYEVLMNCVSIPDGQAAADTVDLVHSNIIYAGGLHLNRQNTLLMAERCLGRINRELGTRIRLHVYTGQEFIDRYQATFDPEITEFRQSVPYQEIIKKYDEYGMILHVESFDDDLYPFLKYSLTTKLPECMQAPGLFVCIAPQNTAIYRYVRDNNIGVAVSGEDELYSVLMTALTDGGMAAEMKKNARQLAAQKFSDVKAHELLTTVIEINCCGETKHE